MDSKGRTTAEPRVRLVLVEVLNRTQIHPYPAQSFPFAHGLDLLEGVQTTWLRIGMDVDPSELAPRLGDEERRVLIKRLKTLSPTHLCLNVEADEELRAELEQMEPAPLVRVLSEGLRESAWFRSFMDWLGCTDAFDRAFPDAVHPLDHILPSYRSENLNFAAEHAQWHIEIAVGRACTWKRQLSENQYFAYVPEVWSWCGCSFCAAADSPLLHTKIAPMETLFRHLKAARALASTPERRLVFNLVGSYPFLHFKEFFNRLLSIHDYPPSQFLFTCRIDEFLRRADELEEMLPAIKAAGHQVAVFSMGIENLSPVENERLNKGITSDQVLKVRQRMASIKARFPDAFDYPPGNLSFILFTPWTTAKDLATNLYEARRIGIDIGGNFLRNRLQLIPGRLVTVLAEADGLLVPDMPDHPFFSGCIRRPDIQELPWRFREPGMEACYAMMRRLSPSTDVPDNDPLLAKVRRAQLHFPIDVLSIADMADLCVAVTRDNPADDLDSLLVGCIRRAFKDVEDEIDARPLSPAMVARVLTRVSDVDETFLWGAKVTSLHVELPWVRMELSSSLGPMSFMLTAARVGQNGIARSKRYLVCTNDEGPAQEHVLLMARRIASILDGVG
ncbi:MAG TPA: hypothetical protein PK329_08210 [Myxococcota bacterium]|nr:hypothetical protein [Oligoflexales bacterium]HOE82929.1 hypothetical protein [Myxococcota bacterium]HOS62932.1 hypothetical protein [Myxococcota bacterium]HPC92221.1 hypothetical protein [Myxococcota bacterium]HPL25426.1 hypothetical protein [Myxococcota bacterium]